MKTVVVTGANRGLGLELARAYIDDAFEGIGDDGEPRWRVIAVARKHTDVTHRSRSYVRTRGIDVSEPDASNALGIVLAQYAPVDVLINNAAVCIGRECAVGNVDYGAWTRSFETNVMGAMRVLEAALPHLARDAVVVNVSGRMGSIGRGDGGPRRVVRDDAGRRLPHDEGGAEHDDGVRRGGVQGEG